MVNQDNLKDFLKNLKKGIQIGVLGTALTAGGIMGVGCANASDGDTKDNQIVTNPGNTGNNQQTGGHTSNSKYDTPYDKTLGNGNYFIHSFIGDKDGISYNTALEDVNHYVGLGETYINDLTNNFNRSLNGRTGAQDYFNFFTGLMNNDSYFQINTQNPASTIDLTTTTISRACEPIMADIVKNLNTPAERGIFMVAYDVMFNEAYKLGMGNFRNTGNKMMDEYQDRKDYNKLKWDNSILTGSLFDLNNDIDNNNCREVTNLTDQLLDTAVTNMNNRNGYNITAADLRQVINMSLTTKSLMAMHDRTEHNFEHTCAMMIRISYEMDKAAREAFNAEQQQNQGMTY